MIWESVINKYGKETARKMKKSSYLQGITVSFTKDGEINYPESDIRLAFKDVMGKKIYSFEMD